MCDQQTQSVLESIVRNVVGDSQRPRKMFTSFDISRTAQQHHGVRLRHNDMKNEPHKLFSQGAMDDYKRVTITLPGVPVDPWLYYPPEGDPVDYVSPHTGQSPTHVGGNPVSRTVVSAVVAAQLPAAAANDDDDAATPDDTDAPAAVADDDGSYKADKRGRIWIPRSLIRALGVTPGGVLYAVKGTFAGNPALSLKANLAPSDSEAVAYKVDRHSNIAVSRGCLVEAGLTGTSFDLAGDHTTIVVQSALTGAVVTA